MSRARVLIADDRPFVLEGLVKLLQGSSNEAARHQ